MAIKFYQKGNYQVLDGDIERIGEFDIVAEGTIVNIIDRNKESNVWNGNISDIQNQSGTSIGSTFSDLVTYIQNQFIGTVSVSTTGTGNDSVVNKFGYNVDIDTASEEVIASFGGAFDPSTSVMSSAQTFTIAYNNTTDGSSGTGARMLLISYIDENNTAQDGYHVLGSSGSDTTSFTGLGVNRAVVVQLGGDLYNNNDITITATTDATTQAQIPAGKSVTQQCIYHTPINRTLNLNFLKVSTLKLSGGGGSPRVNVIGYSYSRVTGGRYAVLDVEIDTSIENNLVLRLPEPITFTGREVIYFEATTDVNNTKVSLRFSGIETDS